TEYRGRILISRLPEGVVSCEELAHHHPGKLPGSRNRTAEVQRGPEKSRCLVVKLRVALHAVELSRGLEKRRLDVLRPGAALDLDGAFAGQSLGDEQDVRDVEVPSRHLTPAASPECGDPARGLPPASAGSRGLSGDRLYGCRSPREWPG